MRIDPRYYRPTEVDYLLADTTRAKKLLNWHPKVCFRELVRIMVDADLELAGIHCPGEGRKILEERFGGWHRWESQVVSNRGSRVSPGSGSSPFLRRDRKIRRNAPCCACADQHPGSRAHLPGTDTG